MKVNNRKKKIYAVLSKDKKDYVKINTLNTVLKYMLFYFLFFKIKYFLIVLYIYLSIKY